MPDTVNILVNKTVMVPALRIQRISEKTIIRVLFAMRAGKNIILKWREEALYGAEKEGDIKKFPNGYNI